MVLNGIRNFFEIHTDYFKLKLRNRKKSVHCPICEKNFSKMNKIVLCKKCDEKFSRYSDHLKMIIINRLKGSISKDQCSICDKKDLKFDNRLIYCSDCGISFHD